MRQIIRYTKHMLLSSKISKRLRSFETHKKQIMKITGIHVEKCDAYLKLLRRFIFMYCLFIDTNLIVFNAIFYNLTWKI